MFELGGAGLAGLAVQSRPPTREVSSDLPSQEFRRSRLRISEAVPA